MIRGKNEVQMEYRDLWDIIERPNVQIMGIEGEQELQVRSIENTFDKIIADNFPNIEKVMVI
jgi:hypothetical protein